MATVKTWVTGEEVTANDLNSNFSKIIATQTYTAGENLAENDSLYINSDGKVYKADADNITHLLNWIGFATSSALTNASVEVQTVGRRVNFTSLTVGATYYPSSTAGAITTAPISTNTLEVGIAVASTQLYIYPRSGRFVAFGGTGADGALSISSGTTTIDCAGAQVVVKNYTSISITGTAKLAFSNPHANGTTVIIKSRGNITLTSSQAPMIDMSAMGAAGGNGGAYDGSGLTAGTDGYVPFLAVKTTGGGVGGLGSGGSAPSSAAWSIDGFTGVRASSYLYVGTFVGAGGGGGCGANNPSFPGTGGAGGRGGGNLIIECGGAWNFTTSSGISVAGANGANGTGTGTAGGGAGGGGGCVRVIYATLTANSGTITTTGGNGGTQILGGGNGANGPSGKSLVTALTY